MGYKIVQFKVQVVILGFKVWVQGFQVEVLGLNECAKEKRNVNGRKGWQQEGGRGSMVDKQMTMVWRGKKK